MKRITISEEDLITMTAYILANNKNSPEVAREVGAIWYGKLVQNLFEDVKDCEEGKSCLIKLNKIL